MSKYEIKGNLSERQIESDVSRFFGWISKHSPYRLLAIDEQLTGADKKFYDSGFAFLMQFKVSKGLEPVSKVTPSTRKNRSALESVREFRQKHGLEDDPTLYFGLRAMSKNASDYQHNILMEYANQQYSQAFYVAPLHLDKDDYDNSLFDSANRLLTHPYDYRSYKLFRGGWVSHVGNVPFLNEHVSIVPHERVTTHKHYYSFSATGCDIGWHSPEVISEKPNRLSDVLRKEIDICINENRLLNLRELAEKLVKGYDQSDWQKNDEPLERIQTWARKIHEQHRIKVFLLLVNRDVSEHFREL
ncbi:hypothetical protein [Idiomarina sp. HP20-50]|uniref:hypothetical protein n=1 Tax=Idiomarina sp. HP20-50 TaxID=3070813 RepID=UPI00294B579E|nr:hypothetical protein [Idiomarina sp. HP20-50]MDV6314817.1 hypothetical protein [Idiomarina sp. HP20-50]